MKPTPKPWQLCGLVVYSEADDLDIAEVQERPNEEETDANARLIAAAPEMLDALREVTNALSVAVREAVSMPGFDPERDHDAIRKARAAIAKAVKS